MKSRRLPRNVGCGLLAFLPACTGWVQVGDAGGTSPDAGSPDATVNATDGGSPDATVNATDGGSPDATVDATFDFDAREEQDSSSHPDAADRAHMIAVLDDSDPDYTNPPFTDRLSLYGYNSSATSYVLAATLAQFNIDQTTGGSRRVAATKDGSRIAVVEDVAGLLDVFDDNLTPVFPPLNVGSSPLGVAVTDAREYVARCGMLPCAAMGVFDATGKEVSGSPSAELAGFDVAVDETRGTIWVSGAALVRGDPIALTGVTVATYGFAAVSLDVAPSDGSVWVAERVPATGGGAIHHYDATGAEVAADQHPWSFAPLCVRVNPHSGDIWVADTEAISRIDSSGKVNVVAAGAAWWSIAVDPGSGTVWVAGGQANTVLNAYAADGTLLSSVGGFSTSQKMVALVF
jgi:hypothetical protein